LDDVEIVSNSFDPFEYQNTFYEYDLDISVEEINQILFLVKDVQTNEQKNTYEYLNILNFPILKNLKQQIITTLDSHELFLRNNWAQLYNKNDAHDVHTHLGSDYSGIIYIQGESPTLFYDRSFSSYSYKFKKNKLLLFPSHIPHQVKRLDSNEERLVVSFNTTKNCKK